MYSQNLAVFFFYLCGCPGQLARTKTNPTAHWISCKPSEHVRYRGDNRHAHGSLNPGGVERNKSLPPLGQDLKCKSCGILKLWEGGVVCKGIQRRSKYWFIIFKRRRRTHLQFKSVGYLLLSWYLNLTMSSQRIFAIQCVKREEMIQIERCWWNIEMRWLVHLAVKLRIEERDSWKGLGRWISIHQRRCKEANSPIGTGRKTQHPNVEPLSCMEDDRTLRGHVMKWITVLIPNINRQERLQRLLESEN